MHELPITQSICDIALRQAERIGSVKICSITLQMGDYCDYVPEILQSYFDLLSEGTAAAGARLIIHRIPATVYCPHCGGVHVVSHYRLRCPQCGAEDTVLRTGREFYVDSMEIEDLGKG